MCHLSFQRQETKLELISHNITHKSHGADYMWTYKRRINTMDEILPIHFVFRVLSVKT